MEKRLATSNGCRAGITGLDEVHSRLHEIMSREFNAVFDLVEQKEIEMRTAAYALALNRIGEAIESQGTVRYFAGENV